MTAITTPQSMLNAQRVNEGSATMPTVLNHDDVTPLVAVLAGIDPLIRADGILPADEVHRWHDRACRKSTTFRYLLARLAVSHELLRAELDRQKAGVSERQVDPSAGVG